MTFSTGRPPHLKNQIRSIMSDGAPRSLSHLYDLLGAKTKTRKCSVRFAVGEMERRGVIKGYKNEKPHIFIMRGQFV